MTTSKNRFAPALALFAACFCGAGEPPAEPAPKGDGGLPEAGTSGDSKPGTRAEAETLKKEAIEILKEMEASSPEPKARIEKSKAAIDKLKAAKKILDALPPDKAGEAMAEVNALLFWAKKMMPIAAAPPPVPPKTPETAKTPEPAKTPDPSKPPETAEPSKPDPAALEREAEVALMDANIYEERHPEDPFMLSVRYLEVAERFQGTRSGLQAQQKVMDAMRRTMEEIRKARNAVQKAREEADRARQQPPITVPTPRVGPGNPPGMITEVPGVKVESATKPVGSDAGPPFSKRFSRMDATACLYRQKNPRLNADVHYLWMQVRFFDGESQVRPVGTRLKITLSQQTAQGPVSMAQAPHALTEDAWKNIRHDPNWNCLSHQPGLDAPVFAREGYPKRPIHANQDILYAFIQHFTNLDPSSVKSWRVRLEIWDSAGAAKQAETPEMAVRVLDSAGTDTAELPPGATADPEDALASLALGEEHMKAGRSAEAEKALKQAIRLFEKIEGAEGENLATCYNRLGSVYGGRRQFPIAEQCIRKAYVMMGRIAGPDNPKLVPFLENLEALLNATGRRPDAQKARAKIAEIQTRAAHGTHP
ncbi:MAG: tetratricopeptide repeat protein [Planctomycetota bacterium]